jgi:hypothetical protein
MVPPIQDLRPSENAGKNPGRDPDEKLPMRDRALAVLDVGKKPQIQKAEAGEGRAGMSRRERRHDLFEGGRILVEADLVCAEVERGGHGRSGSMPYEERLTNVPKMWPKATDGDLDDVDH